MKKARQLFILMLMLLAVQITTHAQADNSQVPNTSLVDGQICKKPTGCDCGDIVIGENCTCRISDGVAEPCDVVAVDGAQVAQALSPVVIIVIVVIVVIIIIIVIIIFRKGKKPR
ncbi:MAG: hypothetical protein SH856_08070 [Flavobacteriales bacterium]|nr:hypothetical protein [Flavobacteriales bacterium]